MEVTITPKFTKNDAGALTEFKLMKNSEVIYSGKEINPYSETILLSHNEEIIYKAVASYEDGIIKNTLLGTPYPQTSIKAGSISSSNSIKGLACSYYGVINNDELSIDDILNLNKILNKTNSFNHNFNLNNQRTVFMYPKDFGNINSIKDSNNFDYINSYTKSTIIYDDIEYLVYILTDATTISNFKQIFS